MLIGNLTREPEVRYTAKGTAVCDIGMAINRYRTGDNGERSEETTYVDVTLWGRQAELAGQYLSKGRSVYIEGRLQLDQWTDKATGQNRSKLRVVGETMQFIGGQDSQKQDNQRQQMEQMPQSQGAAPTPGGQDVGDVEDDDIPF